MASEKWRRYLSLRVGGGGNRTSEKEHLAPVWLLFSACDTPPTGSTLCQSLHTLCLERLTYMDSINGLPCPLASQRDWSMEGTRGGWKARRKSWRPFFYSFLPFPSQCCQCWLRPSPSITIVVSGTPSPALPLTSIW